ncbi:SigB/SigF/SigG family RNA polymerase sigma factor [Nocardia jiangxiensis]|uniref:SigB/SigF/SigG family RNA polymerase sigma factor n=1 Tax=Nocardia jiangxiensis TaxID=282685 RepID=A0ABW6SE60_9NOCA|nr:SigB/SigF/SigG family RNA polymerase sigma factor [Nocardia jiangxiensis]
MVHDTIVAEAGPPRSRHGPNSYDDIDAWFDKLAGCATDDHHREEIRTEIIRLCLPLADHIALRYTGRGESYEDLYQVAQLGLVLAVDRFDHTRGTSFLSFAVPTIMGEVRRYFRDSTWATRVPRRLKDLQSLVGPATERLAQDLERMPTARELATALSADVGDVTQALVAGNAYRSSSLDDVVDDDEDNDLNAAGARLGVEEHCYELTEDAMAVRPLIADLPRRERRILVMRFFESKTQTQIARTLNISQMQVSRILTRTLRELRERALPA